MKLICELFKYKLIDKNLITYILQNLTLDLKKYFKLELGVSLVQNLYKYINNEEKEKFIEFFSIYLKNPNLNKKIKFMILDFIENKEIKSKKIEKKIEIEINDDKIETILKSGINDFIENNNLSDFIENIKKYLLNDIIASKFIYYLILYILENNNIDLCLNLLYKLNNKNFFNNNNIKSGISSFYDDYDDYKWDYKNIDEILEKITNYLLEKKILDNNFNILIKKKNLILLSFLKG